jgi:hypothetical protein
MTWVSEVFYHFLGAFLWHRLVYRSCMAGSLAPAMYWTVRTTPLRPDAEQLPYQEVMQAVRMISTVELFEDLGTHAKYFNSPDGDNDHSMERRDLHGMIMLSLLLYDPHKCQRTCLMSVPSMCQLLFVGHCGKGRFSFCSKLPINVTGLIWR